jgi:hypothetical protein
MGTVDGTGSQVMFRNPLGATLDASGNVFVSDYHNHRIRKVTPVGGALVIVVWTCAVRLHMTYQHHAPVEFVLAYVSKRLCSGVTFIFLCLEHEFVQRGLFMRYIKVRDIMTTTFGIRVRVII